MRKQIDDGKLIGKVLDALKNPIILEFITCNRFMNERFVKFKKSLAESKTDYAILEKICDETYLNHNHIDLRAKPFIKLVYQINDHLNVTARKNLKGRDHISREDINEQIIDTAKLGSSILHKLANQLIELYNQNPSWVLKFYKNIDNILHIANLFQEFVYSDLVNEVDEDALLSAYFSAPSSPTAGAGLFTPISAASGSMTSSIITPKPLRRTISLSLLLDP